MNVVSRGIRNVFRSPLRTGAIVLMLAISIGLILSMLVARSSVNAKIDQVKATAGTAITISPAGVMGFSGGGTPLTSAQLTTVTKTANISSTAATLGDQLGTTDTNLVSSLVLGSFGTRQQRFDNGGGSASPYAGGNAAGSATPRPAPTPRITVTGTTNPNSVSTSGSTLKLTSGTTLNGNSSGLVALIGSSLATKNNLTTGKTFTAYGKTITVQGIFTTGNTFQDSSLIMPLATVQGLSGQPGAITSVVATVDSSNHVSAVVAALKTELGNKVDITSQAAQAAASVASLQSIAGLALAGVIGATIAGAVIVLLAMIMIVRERRHEIGVIKAIGGSNYKVIGQFVSEALTLTVIGTVVGLGLGVLVSGPMTSSLVAGQTANNAPTANVAGVGGGGGLAGTGRAFRGGLNQINTNLTQVSSSITPQIFISAISITLLIAIIGSAVPAWLIARVRPAEVLRTE